VLCQRVLQRSILGSRKLQPAHIALPGDVLLGFVSFRLDSRYSRAPRVARLSVSFTALSDWIVGCGT
jgi:hypothetical protein